MTNFQILSDVHTEFHDDLGIIFFLDLQRNAENLVLAGDIFCAKKYNSEIFEICCDRYENVIFVHGNHEFYGSSREETFETIENINHSNFHWLNNTTVEIDDVVVAGSSLWFDNTPEVQMKKHMLNDFRCIRGFNGWLQEENEKSSRFFETVNADIYISHHLPCPLSIADVYKSSGINCMFLSDQMKTIKEKKPYFWIHGHTHIPNRYKVYDTEIVCNPFGYITREDVNSFNESCIVTL